MSTAILVIAVLAALACPAHMLWHARRGRRTGGPKDSFLAALGARHEAIAAELSDREVTAATTGPTP